MDLAVQHAGIADEIRDGFDRVLQSTSFILGDEVSRFEAAYAAFSGVKHCIGVANGTDALELCLRAIGVGPNDEVIVPANSFAASALAVVRSGANPVFCDVDPDTHLIDVGDAQKRITRSTRAIMPVHLYGQMAPLEEVTELAASAGLAVVEDAAQAQGALRNGKGPGASTPAAATSFYPGKNLGAYGDAGAVLTNDEAIVRSLRGLRNYGAERKYFHTEIGFNSRLDSLQAVVLNVKLKHLAAWNECRRSAAMRYQTMLQDVPGIHLPRLLEGNEHIWHLFVIRVSDRDRVLQELNRAGIGAGIHYPVPIPHQPAFAFLRHKIGDFPVAEKSSREILSLPIYPEITPAQQAHVVKVLVRAMGN